MIRYSFMLMNYASYDRFSDWLALNFHIICDVPDGIPIDYNENPIEGSFFVPTEIHEDFLKAFEEVKAEFRMDLKRYGAIKI